MKIKKTFYIISSFIIFSIFFTIFTILLPLVSSIPLKNGGFKTVSSTNDLYKLIDNFYDPDQFYDYRNDSQSINNLAKFYNQLNSSNDFDVISSFNQAIVITDFKGDKNFYYNSEEFIENYSLEDSNIKSLQLNQKAYDFYNIELESGSPIFWDNISYTDNHIPVLLGFEYKKYYQIGDTLSGNYYNKKMQFEVTGFLKENCSIKYRNVSDICLDTYMIIPYPSTLWEVDNNDFQFESILYFAMINCDILPFVNETQLLKDIKRISNQADFSNFSLVGIDNFQIQNMSLLIFVQEHQKLFIISLIVIFVFANIISIKFFCNIIREEYTSSATIKQKDFYKRIFTFYVILPYGVAFLLGVLLSVIYLKKFLVISFLFGIIPLLVSYIVTYISGKKALLH